jgi:hypothetical protein
MKHKVLVSGHTFVVCDADCVAVEKVKLLMLPEWWDKWIRRSRLEQSFECR